MLNYVELSYLEYVEAVANLCVGAFQIVMQSVGAFQSEMHSVGALQVELHSVGAFQIEMHNVGALYELVFICFWRGSQKYAGSFSRAASCHPFLKSIPFCFRTP